MADPLLHQPGQQILSLFARYPYLTGEQTVRVAPYSQSSRSETMKWLQLLTEAGYLQRPNYLDTGPQPGAKPRVWSTTIKGRRVLEEMGFDIVPRPHHAPERAQLTMQHTVAANDVLIAGELFARAPGVSLLALAHESKLKRYPVAISANGRQEAVVLDGFLAFDLDGHESCLAIEVDRGTEQKPAWQRKVANLIAFANGPYQEVFRYQTLQIAVYVRDRANQHQQRTTALLRWTEEQLDQMRLRSWTEVFRFSFESPTDDASHFFLGDHWLSPFQKQPTPLLALEVSRV